MSQINTPNRLTGTGMNAENIKQRLKVVEDHHEKLGETIIDLRKQLEQAQEPVLSGDLAGPSEGNLGWFISSQGRGVRLTSNIYAGECFNIGNWFATDQSAQNAAKVREVTQRFKIAVAIENARCERAINWSDSHQAKWYFLFNHTSSSIECNWTGYTQVVPANMCFTKKAEATLREQFTDAELRIVVTQEVV